MTKQVDLTVLVGSTIRFVLPEEKSMDMKIVRAGRGVVLLRAKSSGFEVEDVIGDGVTKCQNVLPHPSTVNTPLPESRR